MSNVNEAIICAGFGGQGILTLGKVLATAGMLEGLHVTWIPSYGAEVRGGTAHAMVCVSSKPIASPVVSSASALVIMNGPSLDKFEKRLIKDGTLILNTSLTDRKARRKDIDLVEADLTDEALKLGNVRVANMIAAGIYTAKKGIFKEDTIINAIDNIVADHHKDLVPINIRAIERGIEIAREK